MNELNISKSGETGEKDKRRRSLVKLGIITALAFIVWIFATIAWFAMNKSVTAGGMGVGVGNAGFELRVASGAGFGVESGAEIGFSSLYSRLDRSYSRNSGVETYAGSDGWSICWRMADGDDELMPDSCGTLEFQVVSAGPDISSLHYSLDIKAFTADTETQPDPGDPTKTIEVVTDIHEVTGSASSAEVSDGAAYLKSHIMFFKGRTGTAGNYQYSGFISDVSDFIMTPDNSGNVTIYWVWPNTFGQIALSGTSDDMNYMIGTPILNTAGETNDRSALTTYLTTATFFRGTASYGTVLSDLYTKRRNSESFRAEFDTLSDGYNSADQTIGKNISYALVELNATL
jgi:hypothetical protein